MVRKLSPTHIRALGELANGPMDSVDLMIRVGRNWRQAVTSLDKKGLLAGGKKFRLSLDGKTLVKELLANGQLVRESD